MVEVQRPIFLEGCFTFQQQNWRKCTWGVNRRGEIGRWMKCKAGGANKSITKKRKRLCVETNEEMELRGWKSSQNALKGEMLLGWERQEKKGISGNDKIVNLCPLYLFDYGTSVTSSGRTTEHGPAIDNRRNQLCQSCKPLAFVEKSEATHETQLESKRRNCWELWVMPDNRRDRQRRKKVKCQQCRSSERPEGTQEMSRARNGHHWTLVKGWEAGSDTTELY